MRLYNSNGNARDSTVTIAGQKLTVTQPPCTFGLSPVEYGQGPWASFPDDGGNGIVSVTTQHHCPWRAESKDNWITITSDNNYYLTFGGSGTVNYRVQPNHTDRMRFGKMTIAKQTFSVAQRAPCPYSVAPTAPSYPAAGGEGEIQVTEENLCFWNARTEGGVDWIKLSSGSNGWGSGTIRYSILPNDGSQLREGAIYIGDRVVWVTQAPSGQTELSMTVPSLCQIGPGSGLCSVSVRVTNPVGIQTELSVAPPASGQEIPVATLSTSSVVEIPWIGLGTYTFRLYDVSSGKRLAAERTVEGSNAATRKPSLSGPSSCQIAPRETVCSVLIQITNPDLFDPIPVELRVLAPERDQDQLVARALFSSSHTIPWIGPGTYTFNLYDVSVSGSRRLVSTLNVTGLR